MAELRREVRAWIIRQQYGEVKSGARIKESYVGRYGDDGEWSLVLFDGSPDGVGGKAEQVLGEQIVLLNETRLDGLNTEETNGTIAHERGHHLNEHHLSRFLWRVGVFVPATIGVAAGVYDLSIGPVLLGAVGTYLLTIVWAYWTRHSEFAADRTAVTLIDTTEPVLAMLRGRQKEFEAEDGDESEIEDGLLARLVALWNTHPPLSERINRLEDRDGNASDIANGG